MRKIVITGGHGQLATAICHVAAASRNEYIALGHRELDICDAESVERSIEGADVVINCAAYTNVEGAEENINEAFRINHEGVHTIAKLCTKHNATLIHISTDYVFGGDVMRRTPYTECDEPHPINIYGKSKLAGEMEVTTMRRGIVVRTSWLYSPWGNNFCTKISRLIDERDTLHIVNDQHGTPTSALSLASTLIDIIDSGAIESMQGIYHFSDGGSCTWYDFALEIARHKSSGCTIEPCSSADYPTKAKRPRYSVLDTRRIYAIEGIKMESWQKRLTDVIQLINSNL